VPGPQRHAGGLIPVGAFQEFGAQFLIHPHHPPGRSRRPGGAAATGGPRRRC
jgi:hypothetical protein